MTALSAGVLDYQKQKKRLPNIDRFAILTAVILLPMYYAALLPAVGSVDLNFSENETWLRGGRGIFLVNPLKLLTHMDSEIEIWFIPFGIAVTAIFILLRSFRAKFLVATASVLISPLLSGAPLIHLEAVPIYGPVVFIASLLGWCDGEAWEEGIVAIGVMGAWMVCWAVLWCLALRRFDRPASDPASEPPAEFAK
jgi:hypothetical protein